jgi:sulfur carrier protein
MLPKGIKLKNKFSVYSYPFSHKHFPVSFKTLISSTMISINDKTYSLTNAQSLTDLFSSLNMDVAKGVAVALNNKVIPRTEWNNYIVNKNDKIILIKATQGG